jgi:hypothetical protein
MATNKHNICYTHINSIIPPLPRFGGSTSLLNGIMTIPPTHGIVTNAGIIKETVYVALSVIAYSYTALLP